VRWAADLQLGVVELQAKIEEGLSDTNLYSTVIGPKHHVEWSGYTLRCCLKSNRSPSHAAALCACGLALTTVL